MMKSNEKNSGIKIISVRRDLKKLISKVHSRSMVDLETIHNPSNYKQNHFISYTNEATCQNNSLAKFAKKIQAHLSQTCSNAKNKCKSRENLKMKVNFNKKANQNDPEVFTQNKQENIELLPKLQKCIQEFKSKQKDYLLEIELLKKENRALTVYTNAYQQEIKQLKLRQSKLQLSIIKYQNELKKMKKNTQLVIESQKQVINEQLNQTVQIENENIYQNKSLFGNQQSYCTKINEIINKKRRNTPKIESTIQEKYVIREVFEENESQENLIDQQKDEKLLDEVDIYLSHWFNTNIK